MAWSTPTTSWTSANAVAHTDMNRIEENTEHLDGRYWLSGCYNGSSVLIADTASSGYLQRIAINVADGYKLVAHRLSWAASGLSLRLCSPYYDQDFDSSGSISNYVDTPVDLYSNATGSTVLVPIWLLFKNLTGGAIHLVASTGWSIEFSVESA